MLSSLIRSHHESVEYRARRSHLCHGHIERVLDTAFFDPQRQIPHRGPRDLQERTQPSLDCGFSTRRGMEALLRWKAATGARQHTRIAWQEVFLARGLKEPQGQLEKLWLVVDWPKGAKEPYHCYLAHFHREPSKALC